MPVWTGMEKTAMVPRPAQRPWGTLVASVAEGIEIRREANEPANSEWGAGVVIWGEPCGGIEAVTLQCSSDVDVERDLFPFGANDITFDPFGVYVTRECNRMSGISGELLGSARMRLAEQVSARLAQELYDGALTGNPNIRTGATVPSVTTTDLDTALSHLEDHLAALYGNMQGTIHMSPGALSCAARSEQLVREGAKWYTPSGHLVIADAGYDGSEPVSAVDSDGIAVAPQSTPAAGTEWIYATGPVAWQMGPEIDHGAEDLGATRKSNRDGAIAQRLLLAIYDPRCIHLGVLATLC
jgi:hypothetical protein